MRIGDKSGRRSVLVEYLQQAPHAIAAAIGAPCHRCAIMRARLERRRLHEKGGPLSPDQFSIKHVTTTATRAPPGHANPDDAILSVVTDVRPLPD
jgi:hypothetical protein